MSTPVKHVISILAFSRGSRPLLKLLDYHSVAFLYLLILSLLLLDFLCLGFNSLSPIIPRHSSNLFDLGGPGKIPTLPYTFHQNSAFNMQHKRNDPASQNGPATPCSRSSQISISFSAYHLSLDGLSTSDFSTRMSIKLG